MILFYDSNYVNCALRRAKAPFNFELASCFSARQVIKIGHQTLIHVFNLWLKRANCS